MNPYIGCLKEERRSAERMCMLSVRARGLHLRGDDRKTMKKLLSMIWICTLFVLLIPSVHAAEGAVYPIPYGRTYFNGTGEYFDEGVDTRIEITDFAQYSGEPKLKYLSEGDKIAVLSPSALPDRERIETTLAGLRAWGFEPVEGRYVGGEMRTLEECVEDLKWALADPEIKAIFCVRGGYGATEVLDALPQELIASANKPIIGFSDISAFHAAWICAGLPSVHAGMSNAFGEDFHRECADAELRMLKGELPTYQCEANAFCREGRAEGILIGGNLSTLTAVLDTAYDSTALEQPFILFLEEIGENMQHIHRGLTILKHRGVLDRAAGIVFGEWLMLPADGTGNYGAARGGPFESVADMITRQFLCELDVPVAFGFPAGHGDINYPLLMGVPAILDISADSYTLSWADASEEKPEEPEEPEESEKPEEPEEPKAPERELAA